MTIITDAVYIALATVITAVVILVIWCIIRFRNNGWIWVAKFGARDRLVHVPCKDCDGYGIQYLSNGKLKNITPETRDRQKGKWAWFSIGANKLACRTCGGFGHVWEERAPHNTHHFQRG